MAKPGDTQIKQMRLNMDVVMDEVWEKSVVQKIEWRKREKEKKRQYKTAFYTKEFFLWLCMVWWDGAKKNEIGGQTMRNVCHDMPYPKNAKTKQRAAMHITHTHIQAHWLI